jgi:hypothetical protein
MGLEAQCVWLSMVMVMMTGCAVWGSSAAGRGAEADLGWREMMELCWWQAMTNGLLCFSFFPLFIFPLE